ncbi:LysR family transcriptional regulator [Rhodococcus qingshengii]
MKPDDVAREGGPVAAPPPLPSSYSASRSLLDLHRVKQFEAVARHLNITRAANELYLSQQAVSASVKSLERDLGVLLFERVGRRIELTASGMALREGAPSLLDAASALTRRIYDAQQARQRPFVVAFTPDVSAEDVVDLTASVFEVLLRSTITARQIQPSEIRDQLRKGVADIALSRGVSEADHLASMIVEHTFVHRCRKGASPGRSWNHRLRRPPRGHTRTPGWIRKLLCKNAVCNCSPSGSQSCDCNSAYSRRHSNCFGDRYHPFRARHDRAWPLSPQSSCCSLSVTAADHSAACPLAPAHRKSAEPGARRFPRVSLRDFENSGLVTQGWTIAQTLHVPIG